MCRRSHMRYIGVLVVGSSLAQGWTCAGARGSHHRLRSSALSCRRATEASGRTQLSARRPSAPSSRWPLGRHRTSWQNWHSAISRAAVMTDDMVPGTCLPARFFEMIQGQPKQRETMPTGRSAADAAHLARAHRKRQIWH